MFDNCFFFFFQPPPLTQAPLALPPPTAAPAPPATHVSAPRTIVIQRPDARHGFGFTLRHLVVYPPDSLQVGVSNFLFLLIVFYFISMYKYHSCIVYLLSVFCWTPKAVRYSSFSWLYPILFEVDSI